MPGSVPGQVSTGLQLQGCRKRAQEGVLLTLAMASWCTCAPILQSYRHRDQPHYQCHSHWVRFISAHLPLPSAPISKSFCPHVPCQSRKRCQVFQHFFQTTKPQRLSAEPPRASHSHSESPSWVLGPVWHVAETQRAGMERCKPS